MAIPGPGVAISMNTIATEFGGTVPHSLNEYYRGGGLVPNTPGNAAIPTSGAIPMGSFYGSANRTAVALTIAANSYNYDVYTNRSPAYVAGATDLTVTVNPGVTVGSTSTGAYAMLVPSAFNPGDTVTIVNNGVIQGMGGGGGGGGPQNSPGGVGGGGGSALYVNRPTVVTNNGTLAGGGGGGGGGGGVVYSIPKQSAVAGGGGGGGGAGFNGGGGGSGGSASPVGPPPLGAAPGSGGSSGTSPAGGGGGSGGNAAGVAFGGPGGGGGGRGANGSAGSPGTSPQPVPASPRGSGGGGGSGGNYIVGNPFVTYPATGTRQGGVA